VISPWLINCDASLPDNGVQKNPIEQVKKNRFDFYRRASSEDCPLTTCRNRFARRKNPIATLKKNNSKTYRHASPKDSPLSGSQDRFAGRKNPSNTGHARSLPKRRNRHRNGCPVTTNHLLLPSQRREAAVLLPIAQPNSDFLGSKWSERAPRGRGASPIHPAKVPNRNRRTEIL
jgi:hypothetical protein